MNKFYGRIYKLLAGAVRKLYRIEIVGKENEPAEGPFLVCANHISNQDVVILAASLKHQVRFLAKAELFKVPLLGRLIRALGAYPVERGKGDVGAIKNTLKLLDSGEVVGIYPQGHRYAGIHPADSEIKGGVGLILTKKQIPVLPVAIQTKKFRVRILKKTKVIIGKPICYDAPLEIVGKKNDFYNEVTASVFTKICALLDEDAYPQPKEPRFLLSGKSPCEIPALTEASTDGIKEKDLDKLTSTESQRDEINGKDISGNVHEGNKGGDDTTACLQKEEQSVSRTSEDIISEAAAEKTEVAENEEKE